MCFLPTRKEERQGSDLTVCSMGADYPKNPWEKRKDISVTKTIGGCIGEIQGFTAAQKKNRLEVRGPLVLYSTPEPAAFAPSKTALVPFLYPFRLLLCFVPIESKAKLKWFVCLLYLLDERERTEFRFRVYGLDSVSLTPSFLCCRDGYRRTLPKATLSSFRLFSRLK